MDFTGRSVRKALENLYINGFPTLSDGRPIDGVALDMLLRETIEIAAGFYPDTATEPDLYRRIPMPTVVHHEIKSMITMDPRHDEIVRLLRLGVPDSLRMTIDEILNLPSYYYELYVNAAIEHNRSDLARKSELLNGLDGKNKS